MPGKASAGDLPVADVLQAPAQPQGRRSAADTRTRRTGDQGERPVFQPRSNGFGYTEGDTYTYSVVDTWKGEPLGTVTLAIEEVLPDGQLMANGQQVQMDAQGRVRSQRGDDGALASFEPAQVLWWSKPERGQRRDLSFKESFQRPGIGSGEADWSGSSSVGRARKLDLESGSFEVLPIESSGWVHERVGAGPRMIRSFSRTVWYAPSLGHPVAIDIQDNDASGRLLRRERVELLHVQSARSAP